jgi:hypothetical protein
MNNPYIYKTSCKTWWHSQSLGAMSVVLRQTQKTAVVPTCRTKGSFRKLKA